MTGKWENLRNIVRGYLNDCPIVGMSKMRLTIPAAPLACHPSSQIVYVQNFDDESRRAILHLHMNSTDERLWII
jgi:hypothetical protein